MARAAELVELDVEELESRLNETKQELFNLRFQLATGRLDNVARIGQLRRDVARMLTVLRQREIEAAEAYWSGQPSRPEGPPERVGDGAPDQGAKDPGSDAKEA